VVRRTVAAQSPNTRRSSAGSLDLNGRNGSASIAGHAAPADRRVPADLDEYAGSAWLRAVSKSRGFTAAADEIDSNFSTSFFTCPSFDRFGVIVAGIVSKNKYGL